MRVWNSVVLAIVCVFFLVVVTFAGFWLVAAPVTRGTAVLVDGVTVVQESSTDYTQLIIPSLLLVMGVVALTGAAAGLWRALRGRRQ